MSSVNDGAATTSAIPRRTTDEALPLSFAQQRLWLLDQQPNSPVRNIPAVINLDGALDHAALTEALHSLIARHEVLRTAFPARNGQPVQQIAPTLSLAVPLVDLAALPDAERAHEAERIARAEAEAPFDLDSGPLLRATLLRLAPDQHRLLLTIHHTISDSWSMNVLVRDLAALYQSAVAGGTAALPALAIQYADFAIWQRQWLQGSTLERQLSYWQQQLKDLPALDLPTDYPRPPIQRFQGGLLADRLDPALTAQLHAACRATGTTLYMVLLAAWTVLLQRWSGQDEIVVGSPVANRTQPELNEMIGFFANTLVLRTDLSGDLTVRELLRRVQETTLAAQEHQDVPFEQLVERLQPVRDPSRNPLFQVMFVLQNTPAATVGSDALRFTMQEYTYTGTAKFDLWLSATERGGGLDLLLEYNADLYTEATAQRLLAQFATVVRSLLADLDQPIRAVTVLPQAERRLILEQWTATAAPYPHDQCIHALVAAQAARIPDALAVVFEQQRLTYAELERRATQLAHHLRRLGVGPDVRVGVALERSLELVVGVLGILKAGGAYVPIDPRYPAERIAYMLEDAQAPVLLTQSWLCDQLPPHTAQVVALDPEWHAFADLPTMPVHSGVDRSNLAYVLYTSGSTGQPKGVQIPHQAVANLLTTMREQPGLTKDDTLLAVTTLSFDIATLELFLPLTTGARIVLVPQEHIADSARLKALIKDSGVTVMQATPATWRLLVQSGWEGNPSLRIFCGGEALAPDLAAQLLSQNAALWNMYGPTETTIYSIISRVEATEPITIGRPIANTQAYILDRWLQPVPIGVVGELYIGGAGLARGYRNRPDLTAQQFIPDPFNKEPGARLYRTGDLARYRDDGTIFYLGRNDHQVKVRGFRIELGEIETVLRKHPQVEQAVVVAREDQSRELGLVAYLVATQASAPTNVELRSHVRAHLPEYMVPASFMFLETLPLTPNGKIDRKALPLPHSVRSDQTYVAPVTAAEQVVTALWAHLFNAHKIGVYDNFLELGGHSLLATQLLVQLRAIFQVEITLPVFFRAPTPAGLINELIRLWDGAEVVEEIAQTVQELDGLSADEIDALLSA